MRARSSIELARLAGKRAAQTPGKVYHARAACGVRRSHGALSQAFTQAFLAERRRHRRHWSAADVARLRRDYANTPTEQLARDLDRPTKNVYSKARALRLRKSAEYLASPAACRLRKGDGVGEKSRFRKGQTPWNKGMKGLDIGGKHTRFVKGQMPHTWVPIGTEAVSKDGYIKRKVRDDAPAGQSRHNWKFVHVIVWEEHHGPVPRGYAIKFRNGDKRDTRIENLELISRRQLMARNSVHNLPSEVVETVRLRAQIVRVINRRSKPQHGSTNA